MPLYMLDTDTCGAAIRGTDGIDARMSSIDPAEVCISCITRGEIQFGLAKKPDATRLAELVKAFLGLVRAEPWDAQAADHYGVLRAHLKQCGTPIGSLDEMIAAHALALGAVLVTNNEKHFRMVPGLRIENWVRQQH